MEKPLNKGKIICDYIINGLAHCANLLVIADKNFTNIKKKLIFGNNKCLFLPGGFCKYCGEEHKFKCHLTLHEKHCKLNPNCVKRQGHKMPDSFRETIRQIALEGYKNGTWKGWMNCHSSKMSYPEQFFTKVIENEFEDKNYEYNKLFFQYRLDFAWEDKKKCIEIDGSQHETIQAQKESDKRKDIKLQENGWQVLRIKWKDIFNYPKLYIRIAKNFIDLETDE